MWCSVSRGAAHEARKSARAKNAKRGWIGRSAGDGKLGAEGALFLASSNELLDPPSMLFALKSEEFFRSCRCCASDFFQRNGASSRDLFRDQLRMRRLGAFSAKRNGRKIWAIGFDHEFIERHLSCDVANLFAVFKGDDSGKRNEMPEIDDFVGLIEPAAKTMKDAADLPAIISHNLERIIPGVALMNHNIEAQRHGEIEQLLK